ncbi:hypothetical protein GQ55_1G399500 [Panicum hallii var. hallii]|uniref:Uncharacterized protein n=1 Tax=Panicum hallii var. hallii TaxID=1504633 RepID=A0A2T7FCF9_9POAL|nr:hypothetical protein GQ55_1G399500 [Panicum hallii var. hallii]
MCLCSSSAAEIPGWRIRYMLCRSGIFLGCSVCAPVIWKWNTSASTICACSMPPTSRLCFYLLQQERSSSRTTHTPFFWGVSDGRSSNQRIASLGNLSAIQIEPSVAISEPHATTSEDGAKLRLVRSKPCM